MKKVSKFVKERAGSDLNSLNISINNASFDARTPSRKKKKQAVGSPTTTEKRRRYGASKTMT